MSSYLSHYRSLRLAGVTCCVWLAVASSAQTAEIRLRAQCQAPAALVRLGDVAEILGTPAERESLSAVELFPAPVAGRSHSVGADEIKNLLILRGIGVAEHSFSGAARVTLETAAPAPRRVERVSPGDQRQHAAALQQTMLDYLKHSTGIEQGWEVQPQATASQQRQIAVANGPLRVLTCRELAEGRREFTLAVPTADGVSEVQVTARVSLPPVVVVATRPLARGAILQTDDVRLERRHPQARANDALSSVEEAIGKEATRALVAGQILDTGSLRNPLLIRRGEPVTVYVRGPGVRVRTVATAKEDGSLGDLISVESRTDRQSILARVSGYQEVEVYARATAVSSPPSPQALSGMPLPAEETARRVR